MENRQTKIFARNSLYSILNLKILNCVIRYSKHYNYELAVGTFEDPNNEEFSIAMILISSAPKCRSKLVLKFMLQITNIMQLDECKRHVNRSENLSKEVSRIRVLHKILYGLSATLLLFLFTGPESI